MSEREKKSGVSLDAARVLSRLKSLPIAQALATGPVPLPEVQAPSLEGLSVRVPRPADLTEEDLRDRFLELVREQGAVRERGRGEPVALGDDVQLDVLGYSGGKLIPFSARAGMWVELAPQAALPGFAEALAGSAVGDSLEVRVVLPADYPVESLRGQPARFLVDVRAAREVLAPDPESPELLRALGRGDTLDETMAQLVQELEEELAEQLLVEAQERVLDELVFRAGVEAPTELVDEEIRRRWGQLEGKALAEKQLDADEQQEALEAWLGDPLTRAEAKRRVEISLVLKAIVDSEGLRLTPQAVDEILEDLGAGFGLAPEEAKAAVRADPSLLAQSQNALWHLLAVRHVMSKAEVHFEGRGGRAPASG